VNRYVIISGLPASGKTTLALALADVLSLPLFDKDAYLEALFADRPPATPPARSQLSRMADLTLRENVEHANGAVVASWWKHPRAGGESGTAVDWLHGLSGPRVEVHCLCSPQIAVERFLSRTRHPGHFDQRWSRDELLARFQRSAALGPLGIGRLIEVDTHDSPDVEELAQRIRHRL